MKESIIQLLVVSLCLSLASCVDGVDATSNTQLGDVITQSISSSFLSTLSSVSSGSIDASSNNIVSSNSSISTLQLRAAVATKTKLKTTKTKAPAKTTVKAKTTTTKTAKTAVVKVAVKTPVKVPVKARVKTTTKAPVKTIVKAPVTAPAESSTAKTKTSVDTPVGAASTNLELQPDDLPIRINAGYTSSEWIDPQTKLKWNADTSYDATSSLSVVENFCGGADALWCSYRHGSKITYTIPVLKSWDRYKITLLFDEPMFSKSGSRLFDVYVKGELVRSKVDPFLLGAGKNMKGNIIIAMNDKVKDGVIDIVLKAVATPLNGLQKVILNGLVVEISPYRMQGDFPIRINSGSTASWIDPVTKEEWLPDTEYSGPSLAIDGCTPSSKGKLYCSYRMGGIINYGIRVLDTALRYRVTLYMQEPSFMGTGERLMDIYVENKLIKGGFDIVEHAKARLTPASFTILTDKILDGVIDIRLKVSSGEAKTDQRVIISGIMVERT